MCCIDKDNLQIFLGKKAHQEELLISLYLAHLNDLELSPTDFSWRICSLCTSWGYKYCEQAGWGGEELEAHGEHGFANAARKFQKYPV